MPTILYLTGDFGELKDLPEVIESTKSRGSFTAKGIEASICGGGGPELFLLSIFGGKRAGEGSLRRDQGRKHKREVSKDRDTLRSYRVTNKQEKKGDRKDPPQQHHSCNTPGKVKKAGEQSWRVKSARKKKTWNGPIQRARKSSEKKEVGRTR